MRCFELTEHINPGLPVRPVLDSQMEFHLGGGEGHKPRVFPISNDFTAGLWECMIRKLIPKSTKFLYPPRMDLMEHRGRICLMAERPSLPSKEEDQRALIAVRTRPLSTNPVIMTGRPILEVLEEWCVKRYRFPFPPVGVEVVATAAAKANGLEWEEHLLLLAPGAGFRLYRDGGTNHPDDMIQVSWDGEEVFLTKEVSSARS